MLKFRKATTRYWPGWDAGFCRVQDKRENQQENEVERKHKYDWTMHRFYPFLRLPGMGDFAVSENPRCNGQRPSISEFSFSEASCLFSVAWGLGRVRQKHVGSKTVFACPRGVAHSALTRSSMDT